MAGPLQSPASRLEAWYSQLSARYVDLVGDYAGKERFFIEGDSLLLQVFSAPELDFEGISPNSIISGNNLAANTIALVLTNHLAGLNM